MFHSSYPRYTLLNRVGGGGGRALASGLSEGHGSHFLFLTFSPCINQIYPNSKVFDYLKGSIPGHQRLWFWRKSAFSQWAKKHCPC
jgi:hypothetical protein